MAKNLIIVESPRKAETIEKILGGSKYIVKASKGHVRDLPPNLLGVDVNNDFKPQYTTILDKLHIINELKALAEDSEKIYLATDPDREGEAISWHLAYILKLDPEEKCRIEFHEITPDAIKNALKDPHRIDMDKVNAQQTRRILDRIMGFKLSDLIKDKFKCKDLSGGRVQSVAVKIIADREKEIADFIPEKYWTLNVELRENSKAYPFEAEVIKFKGKKIELKDANAANAAKKALERAKYIVDKASQGEKTSSPQPPFTTSTLQQEANRKLGFNAGRTMSLAQELYEGIPIGKEQIGLITYMRTDSVRLADSACSEIRNYVEKKYGKEYLPGKVRVFRAQKNAQDAHEAIRPTSIERLPEDVAAHLEADQQDLYKLYKLIWERAVASQMSDAVFINTRLDIDAGDYELRASGSKLKFPGFKKLAKDAAEDAEDEEGKKVPFLKTGTALELCSAPLAKEHSTEPPPFFTDATLVKELEAKGIGRPSTYATIIQTIIRRKYVRREGKKLRLNELGSEVLEMITPYFSEFINENFSASMETELDEIAEHKADKNGILRRFYGPFAAALARGYKEITQKYPFDTDEICDKCGRKMQIRWSKTGKFLSCKGFPECRNSRPFDETIGVKCPECGGEIIELESKKHRVYYKCENNRGDDQSCSFISFDKPTDEECPECGKMMVEHVAWGKKQLYCIDPDCPKGRPVKKRGEKEDDEE